MEESEEQGVNSGYVWGQLASAFVTSREHPDAATRERAVKKRENWMQVLRGMWDGSLRVGSRTPVAKTPAWATLQVLHGGFASGNLLAEGPLLPHEETLLARLVADSAAPPRAVLNSYYLSDPGVAELQEMLRTGHYRIDVPEEGALLVVAWLLQQGQVEAAWKVLEILQPFLHRLRFYPLPYPRPLPDSAFVHLQTIGQGIETLKLLKTSREIQVQRESTLIWAPLCDRAVELFLETLEGPIPSLQTGSDGKPVRSATGQFTVQGGWPCQRYPAGWQQRVRTLLEEFRRLRKQHPLCARPERPGENIALLRAALETCLQDPQRLTGREVGRVRSVLAHIVAKRGLPGSEKCRALRRYQAILGSLPTRAELAPVVIGRLAQLPQDEGLDLLDEVLAPVTAQEAGKYRLQTGQLLRKALEGKLRPCVLAPVETLVEQGLITSGEVLARVTPQITAQVAAAGLADPDLRRLYAVLYQAFRRRRSLLLLNLESQVKFRELPWIRAIESYRGRTVDTQERARQGLEQVVTLAITAFPQQILPNKLLQEIRTLAENAEFALPLVDEVAADIFMGAFAEKFLRAAQAAGTLLTGSLYERYYDISYARIQQIDDVKIGNHHRPETSPAFFQLCSERAGPRKKGSYVAYNGTIIEQEQILTTHNLAVLFLALDLTESWQPRLQALAQHCFAWICRRHQQKPAPAWKSRLRMLKNTAYAWRQMLFFLALLPPEAVQEFLNWATEYLATQSPDFQTRFQPAMRGLSRAMRGLPTEETEEAADAAPARRFLGWTTETPWLLR